MKPSVQVLYEYGPDYRPHGSAYIRLIRPLIHPLLKDDLDVTFAKDYRCEPVSTVVADRLWRPDVTLQLAESLVARIRRSGARFVYALDDDFLTLDKRRAPWLTEEHRRVVRYFLGEADRVLVTTFELERRIICHNSQIVVLPNALDERLLPGFRLPVPFLENRLVVGYMGTPSHDDDLLMVRTALKVVARSYPGLVELQIVGGICRSDTWPSLQELAWRTRTPGPLESEYPLFMLWFTSRMRWDIAIAPLTDDAFNACKSDIKFLDYSAVGAAGIYSRVPAYADSVEDGKTGLLVDNDPAAWEAALVKLIENVDLRRSIADAAQRHLFADRVLAKRARDWLAVLL